MQNVGNPVVEIDFKTRQFNHRQFQTLLESSESDNTDKPAVH